MEMFVAIVLTAMIQDMLTANIRNLHENAG